MNTIDKIHIIKTLISSYACRGQSIHPRAYVMLPRASQSYSDDIMLTLITPYLNLLSALRHHCQKVQYIQIFHHQTSKPPASLYTHLRVNYRSCTPISITTHLQSTSYVVLGRSTFRINRPSPLLRQTSKVYHGYPYFLKILPSILEGQEGIHRLGQGTT